MNDYYMYMLNERGILPEDACDSCNGSGIKTYPNTLSYLGGIGGQLMTNDTCDVCWGSGKKSKIGCNLKKLFKDMTNLKKKLEMYTKNEITVLEILNNIDSIIKSEEKTEIVSGNLSYTYVDYCTDASRKIIEIKELIDDFKFRRI